MLILTDDEFVRLTSYLQGSFGINLTKKRTLIEGRLNKYLTDRGFTNFTAYLDIVLRDPNGSEMSQLLNHLTTNFSYFLREWDHFEYLRSHVLPGLRQSIPNGDLRIWSAGCSTGEEPYTLAMLLSDTFALEASRWDKKVLATDISQKALETARAGIYEEEALAKVPPEWRKKYFTRQADGNWQVKPALRDEVIFRSFNLMEESFPFQRKFHVIFCRNVMIYFDKPTKAALIRRFYDHTEPGGYLFVGQSESVGREDAPWQYIMPSVFRKGV